MSRPMGFPRLVGRVLLILFCLAGGPILLCIPAGLWLTWRLPPLERMYLPAYAASTLGEGLPRNLTTVRWVLKTAPKRKPETLLSEDAVAGPDPNLPVALSASALAEGWRGVELAPPAQVRSSELVPYLRAAVYDGDSLWWLLIRPVLYAFAGVLFLYALWCYFRQGSGSRRKQEQRHGRRTKGPELVSALARFGRQKEDGIRLRMQGRGLLPSESYRIPKRLESSHILLMGDTGSGKSSAIRQILRQVKERGESAIVYDPAMDFIGEFFDPERGDLILNPLDDRCPYWSVSDEVWQPEMATTMAAAFLPDKEYEKAFFTDAPRRVLAHLLRKQPQVRDLLRWMGDPDQITLMVKGTPLAALVDPGAPAQRAGVLSSLNMVADSLELLPEWEHTRKTFSTAEWHTSRKRWVFLTSSSGYREKLLPLHSVWLDLFILRMMGYCADPEAKPVWFVLDELASLNKLPQLHTAVTENRKYGNPVVMGLQGRSQMEKRYGQDAEAMLSQPATKIFLKTSEPRAAKWISEAIGEIEVERLKESRSVGLLGSKKSYAMEIATKPLIMASEIAGLAPLHGFIKQENQVVPAHFQLAKKRGKQPAFVERTLQTPEPRKLVEEALPAPVLVPPPTPMMPTLPMKLVQAALPHAPTPAVKKEGFTWDSSHEIE